MQTIPKNIDQLLPHGDALRCFMEQPFIAATDLKHALRARGVFLCRNEKRDTIPVLACCLLSPHEFDKLRERQENREDNLKTVTQTLPWSSSRSLLDALPRDLHLADLISGDNVNYKVLGSPGFVLVGNNPNHISWEFEIEREDLSKNWAATKNNFKGKLRIEKAPDGTSITFSFTNTADETKDLNRKLVQRLKENFKENRDVDPESEMENIRFSSFDNEGRIAFFRSLTRGVDSAGFELVEVTDCGVCPEGKARLPREVKWMEGHVNGLSINGIALQETLFMNERYQQYHKLFFFYSMEAKFKFDNPVAKGTCSIVFEFPEFTSRRDRDLELEVNVSALKLDAAHRTVNKTNVKEELLRLINDCKLFRFEKHRFRQVPEVPELIPAPSHLQAAFNWESELAGTAPVSPRADRH